MNGRIEYRLLINNYDKLCIKILKYIIFVDKYSDRKCLGCTVVMSDLRFE